MFFRQNLSKNLKILIQLLGKIFHFFFCHNSRTDCSVGYLSSSSLFNATYNRFSKFGTDKVKSPRIKQS